MTAAARRLIVDNVAWARRIARAVGRRLPKRHRVGDLESEALFGLVEAAIAYKPCAVPFQGFAQRRVRGAVIDYVRENHMVRPSIEDRRTFKGGIRIFDIDNFKRIPDESPDPERLVIEADLVRKLRARVSAHERQLLDDRMVGCLAKETAAALGYTEGRSSQWMNVLRDNYRELVQ